MIELVFAFCAGISNFAQTPLLEIEKSKECVVFRVDEGVSEAAGDMNAPYAMQTLTPLTCIVRGQGIALHHLSTGVPSADRDKAYAMFNKYHQFRYWCKNKKDRVSESI